MVIDSTEIAHSWVEISLKDLSIYAECVIGWPVRCFKFLDGTGTVTEERFLRGKGNDFPSGGLELGVN